tara:strand:+ start:88 stop:729 length:642 start_codon:yes stop_codon:yes gene_type:complete
MGSKDIPDINLYCSNSIKQTNPDFEYILWKDETILNFMKDEFPEYNEKFNELPRIIMKIDMLRYFLMYKYGGLYTDMDYLMFKPFDMLNEKVVIPCNREDENQNPICLGNCIFASEPNHPFWKSLMDTLFTIDRRKLEYTIDKNIDGNVLGTGPMFVFAMWKKYSNTNNDICVSKRNLFHPPTIHNKEYIEELKKNGCYGMHFCTGLWRNNLL